MKYRIRNNFFKLSEHPKFSVPPVTPTHSTVSSGSAASSRHRSKSSGRRRLQKSYSTESSLNHMVPNSPVYPQVRGPHVEFDHVKQTHMSCFSPHTSVKLQILPEGSLFLRTTGLPRPLPPLRSLHKSLGIGPRRPITRRSRTARTSTTSTASRSA